MKKTRIIFLSISIQMYNPHNLPKDYELVFRIITRHYLLWYNYDGKSQNHNFLEIQSSYFAISQNCILMTTEGHTKSAISSHKKSRYAVYFLYQNNIALFFYDSWYIFYEKGFKIIPSRIMSSNP